MKKLAIIGLSLLATAAHSAQIKTVRNYEDINVTASVKEPNSILLENDRILQMKAPANTLTDACNGKPNCKLIDDTTGILTFMPSPLYHTSSFTINLLTEKGFFYNVRVEPKPIPSQTILLKAYQSPVIKAYAPQTADYEKVMVQFMRALVNGHLPEGFTQTIPGKAQIYKSPRTELKRLLTVKGNDLTGEVFELKNMTKKPLTVREGWFNWPGSKAISITHPKLAPFATTRLYRIS